MEVDDGGNATSTGPMVPVLASNDEGRSRAILTLLEANGIPALLDADLKGAFVGFHDPVPPGWFQVLVPTSMRADALKLLREYEGGAERRGSPQAALHVVPQLKGFFQPDDVELFGQQTASDRVESSGDEAIEEEEQPVVEADLCRSFEERGWLALGAVVLGIVLQCGLSLWVGADEVVRTLGASSPLFFEPYRLITAGFLHGDGLHMVSNALLGLVFGVALFGTHGIGATAFVWCWTSIAGLGSELALSPEALIIGASAGNYGLVGLWAFGQFERAATARLPRRELLKTLGILLLLLPGALTPFSYTGSRVAVVAHVVGFLLGFSAGAHFRRRLIPEQVSGIESRSRRAGKIVVAVSAAAWLVGLAHF